VEEAASRLAEAVAKAETFTGGRGAFDSHVAEDQAESIMSLFDSRNGGFGRAPKFPHPGALDLLLECYQAAGGTRMLEVAAFTLEKMGSGGVYDQLAGGFHRYSVDERWCVPHFEKMSYDNSELLKNFLHGFQVAREPLFREIAEGIIDWTDTVLSDQSRGGFYASQDADQTLDDDGDYFTWTQEEVRAALTPEEARVVELRYDVEARGEMHHNPAKNVLWIARSIADVVKTIGGEMDMATVLATLASAKGKLLAARATRPTPFVDTTLYVAWNAMFVSAYLDAAAVLGGEKGEACRVFALKTLDRILAEAWSDSRGFAHRVGGARLEGSLDDQIFAGIALLDAYEATLDRKYFDAARRISQSLNILTPKAAASSIAPRAPRRWAGSNCAASHCRILPRPAQIPRRRFCSTASTVTRETRATVPARRRRSKRSPESLRNLGFTPRATGLRGSCTRAGRSRW
jgi:uncharacterized protein YyaL (SSP411 family)